MNCYKIAVLNFLFFNIAYADLTQELPTSYEKNIKYINEEKKEKTQSKQIKKLIKKQGNSLDNDVTKHNQSAPIFFKGDSANGSRKTGILNLIGNVFIEQDNTKLTANRAKIISAPGNVIAPGSSNAQKAIAIGNVNIIKNATDFTPELKAYADKVEFFIPEKIIVLTGKAKVWRGKEFLNANTIEMNLLNGDIKLKEPQGTVNPKQQENHLSEINNSSASKN